MNAAEGFKRIGKIIIIVGWIQLAGFILGAIFTVATGLKPVPDGPTPFTVDYLKSHGAVDPVTADNITPAQIYNARWAQITGGQLPYALSEVEQDAVSMQPYNLMQKYGSEKAESLMNRNLEAGGSIRTEQVSVSYASRQNTEAWEVAFAMLVLSAFVLGAVYLIRWVITGFSSPKAQG